MGREGTVRCQHGILPVPVPAVTNIVMEYGIPLGKIGEPGEYVTPTGAAIAAAICTSGELPECYRIVGNGLGAGKRDYKRPDCSGHCCWKQKNRSMKVILF